VAVVISVSYAALWEGTRERERQRVAARGEAGAPGGGRRRPWRRAHGNSVVSPPPGALPLYSGEACTLTPSPS
jgi:hypothetical protein